MFQWDSLLLISTQICSKKLNGIKFHWVKLRKSKFERKIRMTSRHKSMRIFCQFMKWWFKTLISYWWGHTCFKETWNNLTALFTMHFETTSKAIGKMLMIYWANVKNWIFKLNSLQLALIDEYLKKWGNF